MNNVQMGKDVVDIVMATYNGGLFVERQIESILAQDHPHIRLLIRDDLSTDGSIDILKGFAGRYPERIQLLPSTSRLGVRGNFSCLMSHATAEYIMFADQDDVWHRDKVSKTLQKMKEMEKCSPSGMPLLVHTDLTVVDQDLKTIAPSFWRYTCLKPARITSLSRLLVQPVVTGCATMVNRPLSKLALPIPATSVMHDSWMALVAAAFGRLGVLEESTLLYRQHHNNSIGAKKFAPLSLLWNKVKNTMKGVKQPSTAEIQKFVQGDEFLSRYGELLDQGQKRVLNAYLGLRQASFFKKCYVLFRYDILRCGLFRNVASLFHSHKM